MFVGVILGCKDTKKLENIKMKSQFSYKKYREDKFAFPIP